MVHPESLAEGSPLLAHLFYLVVDHLHLLGFCLLQLHESLLLLLLQLFHDGFLFSGLLLLLPLHHGRPSLFKLLILLLLDRLLHNNIDWLLGGYFLGLLCELVFSLLLLFRR